MQPGTGSTSRLASAFANQKSASMVTRGRRRTVRANALTLEKYAKGIWNGVMKLVSADARCAKFARKDNIGTRMTVCANVHQGRNFAIHLSTKPLRSGTARPASASVPTKIALITMELKWSGTQRLACAHANLKTASKSDGTRSHAPAFVRMTPRNVTPVTTLTLRHASASALQKHVPTL